MQGICNAWAYYIKTTQPNLKISQKSQKTPKNFQKPQNLGLKCMNAWEKRVLGSLLEDKGLI